MDLAHDGLYEIALLGECLDQDAFNILHYSARAKAAWLGTPTMATLVSAVMTRWTATLKTVQGAAYILPLIECRRIIGYTEGPAPKFPPRPLYSEFFAAVQTGVGDVAGNWLPSYVAATCRKRTGLAGRRWQGSFRLAGLAESQTDAALASNYLTAAAHAAITTAWNDFANVDLNLGGNDEIECGVLSLRQMQVSVGIPGPVINPANYWNPMQSTLVNQFVGSQVSRKVNHGT